MSNSTGQMFGYPVDLQVHSNYSDGTEPPEEVVRKATALGVRVLAFTDHDTVAGIDAAIVAGKQHGVTIVPAVEFSTKSEKERDYLDVNILGYGIQHHDAHLTAMLTKIYQSRLEQKIQQIERLQAYGIDVTVDAVLELAGGTPGRVHIARVAMERNPERFQSIQEVFEQYLAADAPNSTYVARAFSLRVEEAIELTHAAQGLAVLAHPGSYTRISDIDAVVRCLRDAGLDGLEVSYTYAQNRGHHGASASEVNAIVAHFRALAQELSLMQTGGSDYHGMAKPGIKPGQAGLTWPEWQVVAARLRMPSGESEH